MTMSNGWQKAYKELKDFVTGNPGIEVGKSVTSIPGDVRPEFYRLFDRVRAAFIEEKFPALLDEASLLSGSYVKVEQEVTELLGLDSISMSAGLRKFLCKPKEGLIEVLFDPLFDFLKGKVDVELFQRRASEDMEATFRGFYQSGYEMWVALCLVKLLDSDKNFHVNLNLPAPKERIRHPPATEGLAPSPEESKCLSFEHQPSPTFTVPDFIVHSTEMNRYVAFRAELVMPISAAFNASEKREWYPLDSILALDPCITLIYIDNKPEDISLVADKDRICRPDLIIKCMVKKDWYQKEGLEKVKLHHDTLKPKMGTYIISQETALEQELEKPGEDIYILTVGFDSSKLASVISTLMSKESHSFVA